MTSSRPTIELINPAAIRSYGSVKRIDPAERARPQQSNADDRISKGRIARLTAGQPVRSLNASRSLLQTGPLLAAQAADAMAVETAQGGIPSREGVQAYRLVNGDVPGPVSILIDWQL